MIEEIKQLLKQKNAVLVAHYYVSPELQDLAEETGGITSDSLEMARFGKNSSADIIVVAGVKFMGETAKILSPEKKVLVLDKNATCSLDEGCPIDEFSKFCDENSNRTIVVYANTSAEIKAKADWVVTSGSALSVVKHLKQQGEKILWAPDKHLGYYVKTNSNADMILWDGHCVVHEKFKADSLKQLKQKHPSATILVHPESPKAVIELADLVGSTTAIIDAVRNKSGIFIVATDNGIFHQMQKVSNNATLIEAPSRGYAADCESCAHCDWMAMNNTEKLLLTIKNEINEINIDPKIITKAQHSINRLLNFTK
jgi:quinolinate synthase